jgi:hypothetical protein
VYKRTPVAELHARFCEPLARGSPIRRVHGFARAAAGGFSGEASADGNKFVQVDELLDRVINLTSDFPTSGSRMRNIAGLFPEGKGPSEAEIEAAHNFDRGQLEFLKQTVTNIRSSFVQFKQSQDDKCARYEQEAEAIVKEMNRREHVVRPSLPDRAAVDVRLFFICEQFFLPILLLIFSVCCGIDYLFSHPFVLFAVWRRIF